MKKVVLNDGNGIYVHNKLDYISRLISSNHNYYEHVFLNYIKTNHNNQKNIIDIGANIGNHSHFFFK